MPGVYEPFGRRVHLFSPSLPPRNVLLKRIRDIMFFLKRACQAVLSGEAAEYGEKKMKDKNGGKRFATVDERGRLVLPEDVAHRFGLVSGEQVYFDVGADSIRLRRPLSNLARIYVEPTTRCNMDCTMCQRQTWSARPGDMSLETFRSILEAMESSQPRPSVVFGGFGEPLMHGDLMHMIEQCKELDARVELITNGLLLTPENVLQLKSLHLDRLWLSVDGFSDRCSGHIRDKGGDGGLAARIRKIYRSHYFIPGDQTRTGLIFVAMKENIHELPDVLNLGRRIYADRVLISNLLPHTRAMTEQILYARSIWNRDGRFYQINTPRMDLSEEAMGLLMKSMRCRDITDLFEKEYAFPFETCPFIEKRSLSVRWDGGVSPCQPLLHTHVYYRGDQEIKIRECTFGHVGDRSLLEIWNDPAYLAFRKRVTGFDFSPCVSCASCELAESNEEDCFGNGFPTCGGCLWAQGFIRCP